jgi:hypothetical protein
VGSYIGTLKEITEHSYWINASATGLANSTGDNEALEPSKGGVGSKVHVIVVH